MSNKVIHGDAISELGKIRKGSIDLIFADPPYNLSKSNFNIQFEKMATGGKGMTTNKGGWDMFENFSSFENWCNEWIKDSHSVLKDTGTIWICGTYHNIYLIGYLLEKNGFEVINEVIWHKVDATPNLSCTRLVADHETIICARKKGGKNYFNYEEAKKYNNGKQLRSVWSFPKRLGEERLHPTQKPIWLLERVIKIFSKKGDTVLDPFLGSGTTAYIAKKLGRKYIGIEKEEKYVKIARKRLGRK